MGPVGSAQIVLEAGLLQLQCLLGGKAFGSHTNILCVTDLIGFGEASIVHRSGIPEDKITGFQVDLDELAPPLFKPLHILLME